MRIVRRLLLALAALLVLIVLGAAAAGYYFVTLGFPQTAGRLQVPGLHAPVQVVRDRSGIPNLFADSAEDLFFAQGYVHAQDRLWQMEFQRRIGRGRLSEVLGEPTLKTDRFLRTIGTGRAAEADFAALEPDARSYLEAYARGVNAYITTHADRLPVEFRLLGFRPEPWQPTDSLVWGKMMAWNLGGNWENELLRSRLAQKLGTARAGELLLPYPAAGPFIVSPHSAGLPSARSLLLSSPQRSTTDADRDDAPVLDIGRPDLAGYRALAESVGLESAAGSAGSNNWVVAGSHTATGQPMLANDPHLGIQMPSIWYEIGLHGGGFDVAGASLPGAPGIVIGHNARIAWGVTNLPADVQDLYVEHTRTQDGKLQAEFQGRWEDVKILREEIKVKGHEPAIVEVKVTRHGPLINDVVDGLNQPVAFKWTATAEPSQLFQAIARLDRAANWDEFRAALRFFSGPSQNFVYADVDGNIGYQAPGLIPIRTCPTTPRCTSEGLMPAEGWTGDHEWTGYIPFEDLPSVYNPPDGIIVTANNQVVSNDYRYSLSAEWDAAYRAQRILELLRGKENLTADDFRAVQADTHSPIGAMLLPHLLALPPKGWLQEQALAELQKWDGRDEPASTGAALAEVTYRMLLKSTFADELGPDLFADYAALWDFNVPATERVLAQPDSPWFDDITTPGRETRDAVVAAAFYQAVDWLANQFGDVPKEWTWGRLHTAQFVHGPLGESGIGLLERAVNRGPYPARGGTLTVDRADYGYATPYTIHTLASYRQILDLADFDRSQSIHTTGQSGHPFHPHYADLIERWQTVRYHPMPFSRQAILANASDRLTLEP